MGILNHPIFIGVIIACLALEYVVSRRLRLANFSAYEATSNLVFIGIDKILVLLMGAEGGILALSLWQYRLFDIEMNSWVKYVILFLVTELAYYCVHWYNHHVNIGWATHSMHHSPTKYNLTVSYRLGITRMFSLGWVLFLPLVIIGFHPKDVAIMAGVILLYQFFLHTELIPRLGFLDLIFATPSNHRVHHSSDPRFYNKNLGGITTLFDHLFGTYQAETETMTYGNNTLMAQRNILHEIFQHWSLIFKALPGAKGLGAKLKIIFGPPRLLSEKPPVVIWFTGLSGAGKSTLARGLADQLRSQGYKVEELDGDSIRQIFPQTGFTKEERDLHIQRVGYLASRLERHGVTVIASLISPYEDSRQFVRKLCKNFIEVHLSTPLGVCAARDPKGLYKKVREGAIKNFTGVDDPYEAPQNPDLRLDTSHLDIESCLDRIMSVVKDRG